MPNDIEQFANGAAAFVSAREVAWHRLGTVTDSALSAEEACKIAYLNDWNVRTVEIHTYATGPTGNPDGDLLVPDAYATVRRNPVYGNTDVLGIVGKRYVPIQNEEAFSMLDTIMDEGGAYFETAGSLAGGKKVFMSMKIPQGIRIGGEDAHEVYLLAYNSHDGSSAFTLAVTPVRVVCQNTLTMGLKAAKQTFTMRHTSSAQGKIQQAREALQLTHTYLDEFNAELTAMLDQEFTDIEFQNLTKTLLPVNEEASDGWAKRTYQNRSTLNNLFTFAETNDFGRGTKYAAYNAITEYADWYAPIKGTDPDGTKRATRAMLSPTTQALKDKGLALLRA